MLKDHQIRILMLANEVESALVDIYSMFSANFPEHDNLWKRLIKEEQEHADAIRKLYQLTYEGASAFDEGKIKVEGVQSILDYIKGLHSSATQGKCTAKKALAITCDIEKSLIEKDFYSHFMVSSQYAGILQMLAKGAKSHADLARQELDKLG